MKKTYIRFQSLGISEEGINDLPGGHDDHVDGDKEPDHKIELVIFHHFLVQLYVSKNRMDPPCFTKHWSKAEGEPWHQNPGPRRADVGKGLHRGHVGVQAQDDDRGVGEDAPHDD